MEKQEAMKTITSKKPKKENFREVQLDEEQVKSVKGGNGNEEEDGSNGIVGEVDIIDL